MVEVSDCLANSVESGLVDDILVGLGVLSGQLVLHWETVAVEVKLSSVAWARGALGYGLVGHAVSDVLARGRACLYTHRFLERKRKVGEVLEVEVRVVFDDGVMTAEAPTRLDRRKKLSWVAVRPGI